MNAILLRQAFDRVKAANGSAVTVPADLRLEAPLSTTSSTLTFNHKVGEATIGATGVNNTEIRLDINDQFTVIEIGLFVAKPGSATDAQFDLYSYPNNVEFSSSNTADSLRMLFNNSFLNISKQQVQYLQNYSTLRFRKGQITQNGLGFGAASATPTLTSTVQDSFNGSEDGFTPLGLDFSFTGRDTMTIQVQMPTSLQAVESNSRAILIFRGFKTYNVAR
jgi:hypothetical protein